MPRTAKTPLTFTFTTAFGAKHTFTSPVSRQAARVIDLIKRDGRITRLTAMHYGIANLTARIAELRIDAGVTINCEEKRDAVGRRYGEWTIDPRYTFV